VKFYTDRIAYHVYYYHGDIMKCKNARVNGVKIKGICGGCLEGRKYEQQEEKNGEGQKGEVDEVQEAKDKGWMRALRRMIAGWLK
jgi:hypothetical protein